jgi:hypothetical protein
MLGVDRSAGVAKSAEPPVIALDLGLPSHAMKQRPDTRRGEIMQQ